MANLMQKFENTQIERLVSKKRIPAFRPGDTIKVTLKIVEGERSRLQIYEGICIAKKNNSENSILKYPNLISTYVEPRQSK